MTMLFPIGALTTPLVRVVSPKKQYPLTYLNWSGCSALAKEFKPISQLRGILWICSTFRELRKEPNNAYSDIKSD